MTPAVYEVVDRRDDLADTVTLWLRPVGRPLVAPAAGQFNMMWSFGVGEAPISLSDIDGQVLAHTIRRVGAVTNALAGSEAGDQLGLRGPFGAGWDLSGAAGHDVLIVAGGLGLAPLRPLLCDLRDRRDDYGRIVLLVGARSPEELLFAPELDSWRDVFDVEVTVDSASRSWTGHVGVVTTLIGGARIDPDRTTAFICGPEIMMRFAARATAERGMAESRIQLSLERNMACAIGHCGHCQLGPVFVCRDGPVFDWPTVEPLMAVKGR